MNGEKEFSFWSNQNFQFVVTYCFSLKHGGTIVIHTKVQWLFPIISISWICLISGWKKFIYWSHYFDNFSLLINMDDNTSTEKKRKGATKHKKLTSVAKQVRKYRCKYSKGTLGMETLSFSIPNTLEMKLFFC